jgi:hypothetical protein
MELTGGADCGATGGDEKSERVEEVVASGGSVRVERWVRRNTVHLTLRIEITGC